MIYVRGADSEVAKALSSIYPIEQVPRGSHMPKAGRRYLFCVGKIVQRPVEMQSPHEICDTFWVNTGQVLQDCEVLLNENPDARICIVGSDSGFKGSFDMAYAASKAGLHKYIETRALKCPHQQLVGLAPSCIVGTNMNKSRNADGKRAFDERLAAHPKKRFLTTLEVARAIHWLLCVDSGYITNVVIRMNGGEHLK